MTHGALSKLRVVLLATVSSDAGVGRVMEQEALALREMGAQVEAWVLEPGGGASQDRIAAAGFATRVVGGRKHSYRVDTSRRLASMLAQAQPDVVHAHCYEAALHACRARAAGAIERLIITHHDARLRLDRRVFAWPYRNVPDVITAPSPGALGAIRRWFGYPPQRSVALPNEVADAFFQPRDRNLELVHQLGLNGAYPVVMWIARVQRHKGHEDLVRAFATVMEAYPRARLVLVGDGKHRPALEALSHRLGLESKVLFTGARRDVPDLLSVCDIFVCPSHAETLCLSVLEAMAAGKPVVSTAVWGPGDYIRHECEGLLVPPRQPNLLAEAIVRLAADRDFSSQMAARARAVASAHFSRQAVAQKLCAIYQTALGSAAPCTAME